MNERGQEDENFFPALREVARAGQEKAVVEGKDTTAEVLYFPLCLPFPPSDGVCRVSKCAKSGKARSY